MLEVLRRKFLHAELAQKLVATGDRYLVEGNTWGDTFWGMATKDGKLEGDNVLGDCLMQVRKEIKAGWVDRRWSRQFGELELLRCR